MSVQHINPVYIKWQLCETAEELSMDNVYQGHKLQRSGEN